MNTQNTKPQLLVELFEKAVAAAQPGAALVAALPPPAKGRNLVLGIGKAALSMGLALESTWPADAPLEGLLVGPAGLDSRGLRRLRYLEGAHPVPDAGSEAAALALLTATHGLSPEDQVIALISGGASAQACAPVAGLSLADKQALTQALLASGAGIHEMNTVRKHLSRLKGGRLAAACAPASLHSFIVSDVPGDQLDVIGSGPTLADPSSCAQALEVLERYRIALPPGLRERLASGELETPKPGDPSFAGQQATLIASPQQALLAAAELARQRGWSCHLLSDALEGEARVTGALLAQLALAAGRPGSPFQPPCLILSGGETTVTLQHPKPGQGGRNAETLLACWLALQGRPGAERIQALMADTDGIDGAGPGAGAWFDGAQAVDVAELRAALAAHDAGGFFARRGQALMTGPTGTNVNDFRALLIA